MAGSTFSREMYPPIADYGMIGDCRTAALVSRDGSLDWLCLPRFDSPSLFGALLDASKGGRFRVRPRGPFQVTRRYLPDTNVLETTFRTTAGAYILRDLMPVSSEEAKQDLLTPDHEVLRELEGLEGEVELEILYQPRPDYARRMPHLEDHGPLGLWCHLSDGLLVLRSDVPLITPQRSDLAHGRGTIRAGERKYLSLAYSQDAPPVIPPLGDYARQKVHRTIQWWRGWTDHCAYDGPYHEAVMRSALVLKLLTYAPSGAIIAAPTTSLPEHPGGVRNWDYRY